jgi:hypothetical protein
LAVKIGGKCQISDEFEIMSDDVCCITKEEIIPTEEDKEIQCQLIGWYSIGQTFIYGYIVTKYGCNCLKYIFPKEVCVILHSTYVFL